MKWLRQFIFDLNQDRLDFMQDWYFFKFSIRKFYRRIWNAGILFWWYRLWIRRDEFHISLSLDEKAMSVMGDEYLDDLYERRGKAHVRSMARSSKGDQ